MNDKKRSVGRPKGMQLSAESKKKISDSKKGYKHTEATKLKISNGVRKFHETGAPIELIMAADFSECGKFEDKRGYIRIDISNPIVGGLTYTQLYHVAVVERSIGRKLLRGEEIHHWANKCDNRIEMITLCNSRSEHKILDKAKKILDRERSLDEK